MSTQFYVAFVGKFIERWVPGYCVIRSHHFPRLLDTNVDNALPNIAKASRGTVIDFALTVKHETVGKYNAPTQRSRRSKFFICVS